VDNCGDEFVAQQIQDGLVVQQVVLAIVAMMLCVFIIVRNKKRVLTRHFRSGTYVNISEGSESGSSKQDIDVRNLELPQIDEVTNTETLQKGDGNFMDLEITNS